MDAYDHTQTHGIVFEKDYPYSYLVRQNYKCYDSSIPDDRRFYNTGSIEEDNVSNERLR